MLTLLIACTADMDTSAQDTASIATIPAAGAPAMMVWEYACGEETPEWTMPAGTIVGIQHVRYLNAASGVVAGETVVVSPDEESPLVNGENPADTCTADWGLGGRIVVTYLP